MPTPKCCRCRTAHIPSEVLRPLLKACREGLRLETEYVSFATPVAETRLIAPHTLVYTGMRWHVRAYCEKNGAYRDFVLSRLRGEPDVLDISEFSREADTGWNTRVNVMVAIGSGLNRRLAGLYGLLQLLLPLVIYLLAL